MLIIDSKDCENIDKALKKYKKKFEKAKILVQLRERQSYTKPSVKRIRSTLAIWKIHIRRAGSRMHHRSELSGREMQFSVALIAY